MLELRAEPWLLAAALFSANAGMGWIALSMPAHWRQVCGAARHSRFTVLGLKVLGFASLLLSLGLCLLADVPTMAVLVWMMALAASASWVGLLLGWRPRSLAPLVLWAGATD